MCALGSPGKRVGNAFEEDTNAPNAPVQNYQLNNSNVSATTNANVYEVKGSVSVTGAAIGNNAQALTSSIAAACRAWPSG